MKFFNFVLLTAYIAMVTAVASFSETCSRAFAACTAGPPTCIDGTPATVPAATPANLKIGMIGDQNVNDEALAVLKMMKDEGVELILLAGDFGYGRQPPEWKAQLAQVFGDEYPFLMAMGNHDWDWDQSSGWAKEDSLETVYERANTVGTCHGWTGVDMVCTYKGITMVLIAPGVTGAMHDSYVADAFAKHPSRWRICVFHKNQAKMQLGRKGDDAGWPVYEECRRQGALIQTGHEHSYARSHEMTSFENQTVKHTDPDDKNFIHLRQEGLTAADGTLQVGTSTVFVNGCGGTGLRDIKNNSHTNPWWAVALGKNSHDELFPGTVPLRHGAVICSFNHDGQADEAKCRYKQIGANDSDDGMVRDTFTLKSHLPAPGQAPGKASTVDFVVSEITNPDDDVEVRTGVLNCESSALDMGEKSGRDNTVGLRFESVAFDPSRAADISEARLNFKVDVISTGDGDLNIFAELSASSLPLCANGLDGRTLTDPVNWKPPLWDGVGENIQVGDVVPSPDLQSLVKQVIQQPGWSKGDPITFIITGTGTRVGVSYDEDLCGAPKLIIETSAGTPSPPPATTTPASATCEDSSSRFKVQSSGDDLEERVSDGNQYCDSSDLEFTKDLSISGPHAGAVQRVGLRFASVTVQDPNCISAAFLHFIAKTSDSEATSLDIRAELAVVSTPLCGGASLESRKTTNAHIVWENTSAWIKDSKQQSPNLASLVQEVVTLRGWRSGSPITFIITGSGTRSAKSFDADPELAPELEVIQGPESENEDDEDDEDDENEDDEDKTQGAGGIGQLSGAHAVAVPLLLVAMLGSGVGFCT